MRKTGIYAGMGYKDPIEQRLAWIKDAGFDAVCLDFEKELEGTETPWDNQVRLARKYDLPVEAVHLTGTQMTEIWRDGEAAEFVTKRLIAELRDVARLGIACGVAH